MKILSYNICEGGQDRLSAIATLLRAAQPDAIALLEVTDRAKAATLSRELDMHLAFGEANCAYHIAWLSRLPIRRSVNHRQPGLAKTLLEIELDWQGTQLHLFATHLASRHEPPEPADEIPIILNLLAPLANQPHLLAGDFNALHPHDPIGDPPLGISKRDDVLDSAPRPTLRPLLDSGYTDCYRRLHPHTPGYTYPAASPWLRLDYLFANPALASHLESSDLIATLAAADASDHLPIWATLR